MILAHYPAGYITAQLLFPRFKKTNISYKTFLVWSLLGAVAPDFDIFYFYFIDHSQHHHHKYFSHFPIVWFLLLGLSLFWYKFSKKNAKPALALIFSLGGCVHMILDSLVGDIWWGAPFIDKPFSIATVPVLYHPWWVNFFLHWSFGFEIFLFIWSVYLWWKPKSH